MGNFKSVTILVEDELQVVVSASDKRIEFVNGFGETLTLPLTDEVIGKLEFIAQSARVAILA